MLIWGVIIIGVIVSCIYIPLFMKSLRLIRHWNEMDEQDRRKQLRTLMPKTLNDDALGYLDKPKFRTYTYTKFGILALVVVGAVVFAALR